MSLHLLHEAIAGVCPITGLRRKAQVLTIDYSEAATGAERAAAEALAAGWDFDAAARDFAAEQAAKQELEAIDRASIRGIREWVAAQPSAPAALVALEARASDERGKIPEGRR